MVLYNDFYYYYYYYYCYYYCDKIKNLLQKNLNYNYT